MICWVRATAVAFFIVVSIAAVQAARADVNARRVLVLNEVGTSYPAINLVDQGVRESLSAYSGKIDYYREYMDVLLFPEGTDQRQFRDFYIKKYRNRRPDLIITVGSSPLVLMAEIHDTAFPDVPVVFCLSNNVEQRERLGSSFTGVSSGIAAEATLRTALNLLPDTTRVVVVAGSGQYDKERLAAISSELGTHKAGVEVSYLTDFTTPVLVEQLKRMPRHTIVLLGSIGLDAAGRTFSSADAGQIVAGASSVPVFSLLDVYLGHGEVGGYVSSILSQGRIAGKLSLEVLNGTKPRNIPIARAPNSYMFDWNAIKRWSIRSSQLPGSSVLLNRPLSLWESHKRYIVSALIVALAQTLLIVALLVQRRKRCSVEAQLRESEQRFRHVANSAPVLIWMSGRNRIREYFNDPWLQFTGRSADEESHDGWLAGIHPADLRSCFESYQMASDDRKAFTIEYRLRRNDGEFRWILDTGVPRTNPNGSFCGYIGSCIDVTERKLAEEALSHVGRRLLEAQEQERARVALELHDDIVQRLALLQITVDCLVQALPKSRAEIRAKLDKFSTEVFEVSKNVQGISHRLHSSKLEYLGMVRAMESFCQEVSEQYCVPVYFIADEVPDSIPDDVARCLFRVLQAALSNAVRHSGAQDFTVEVTSTGRALQLAVRDSGTGFDVDTALCQGGGIGLVTMRERVRLVDGRILIASKPNAGTTIKVEVPVTDYSAGAAG